MNIRYPLVAALMLAAFSTAPAWAHGEAHGKKSGKPAAINPEEKAFGKQGDPKRIDRTIHVDMNDKMRFTPSALTVKQGETIRFIVKNSGKVMHEFVLGNMAELKEHAELMKKFPDMEHDEPYMAHVSPGKTETIVWQFTRAGEFHFGCLLPGHFEAGMVGKVNVTRR
ncbi:MAG: cupredoxin family protein [Burkholderiales bacterium]|nr:cupredoxin family protein [Burkholderiales bacterium]